jgi:hypothetical protein
MGPIGCPETSAMNYHYTLRNILEEHGSIYNAFFFFVLASLLPSCHFRPLVWVLSLSVTIRLLSEHVKQQTRKQKTQIIIVVFIIIMYPCSRPPFQAC